MDNQQLENLGFTVREVDGLVEADLELTTGQLMNPLARRFLTQITFTVLPDRLLPIGPPEMIGGPPIVLAHVTRAAEIEEQIVQALNERILQLSRRSSELAALGIPVKVDPETLHMSAELTAGEFAFVIAADWRGAFRVMQAAHGATELNPSATQAFDLSEFRERAALEGYLTALAADLELPRASSAEPAQAAAAQAEPAAPTPAPAAAPLRVLTFGDVVKRFGAEAVVPPRSALELVIELTAAGQPYRFAAARVTGSTLRGLLAGARGRVWAERFELDDFPGIPALVSQLLGVRLTKGETLFFKPKVWQKL